MDRKIQIIEYKNFAANETISDGAVYGFIRQYTQASLVNRGNSSFIIFLRRLRFSSFGSKYLVILSWQPVRYRFAHKVRYMGYFEYFKDSCRIGFRHKITGNTANYFTSAQFYKQKEG